MFFVRNVDYNLLQATGTSLTPLACHIVVHQPYTVVVHDGELAVWRGIHIWCYGQLVNRHAVFVALVLHTTGPRYDTWNHSPAAPYSRASLQAVTFVELCGSA
jgi:hypothetical protein